MSALLDRLVNRLQQENRLVTAFSGGVDSALLARVAHMVLGENAVAVTAVSASLPTSERLAARAFAREQQFAHFEVCTDELDRTEYVKNLGDRCFHCKSALFDALTPVAGMFGARIALGTNFDDLGEHRPGQAAAVSRGAVLPLVDARLTKADVRALSAQLGLRTADKPAAACLSSRVAYGDRVTPELLAQVELAEAGLRQLGLRKFRVRAHADGAVARIEVDDAELAGAFARRSELAEAVRATGFAFFCDARPSRTSQRQHESAARPTFASTMTASRPAISLPLDFATVDVDRERRQGLPEAVFAPGKTPTQLVTIVRTLLDSCEGTVLVTRVEADVARCVQSEVSAGIYDAPARLLYYRPTPLRPQSVVVVSAGTADWKVAAEAVSVARVIGLRTQLISDVGVAGLHRLLAHAEQICQADVVIVIAGMEGALASVVGGLVAGPVIAVPTSTGYGAALDGVTALLAMLTSCAAGVTVVNINSGFGAAMAAHRLVIALRRSEHYEGMRDG